VDKIPKKNPAIVDTGRDIGRIGILWQPNTCMVLRPSWRGHYWRNRHTQSTQLTRPDIKLPTMVKEQRSCIIGNVAISTTLHRAPNNIGAFTDTD